MHNLHGDVPPEHLELALELEELEAFFDSKVATYEKDIVAKSYVLMAHDWYEMGDDDRGAFLLEKADKICPGYFTNQMYKHMEEDGLFDTLVKNLTAIILSIAGSIVYGSES